MGHGLLRWLEPEEGIGRLWHRWAGGIRSYPDHPGAAVTLREIAPTLAVLFRLAGADPASEVAAISARDSHHRLGLRQRLGTERETLELAQRRESGLLLPARIGLFASAAENRDLYLWLAVHSAALAPAAAADDPLERDLTWLRSALRDARRTCEDFPGLAARYDSLCRSLLTLRPERRLPPVEADLEAAIRAALGGPVPESERAHVFLRIIEGVDAPGTGLAAPRGYRGFLPVPLWPRFTAEPTGAEVAADEDANTSPDAQQTAGEARRQARRKRQDQTERDDPLVFNRFEKMLSFAEMVNVNRAVDDEEDEEAAKTAEQLEEIVLSRHRQSSSARLQMALDLHRGGESDAPLAAGLRYAEWDFRRRAYLPDHCAVQLDEHDEEKAPGDTGGLDTRRQIRRVRRQFEALRPRRVLLRGQRDGDALDLDAVVRALCDRAASGWAAPGCESDRLFLQSRALDRDMAVATLVDRSLSTDAWVNDRRVIDVEREALLVFAHGLDAAGDEHAIYSFTSRRRQRVSVTRLKAWDDPVDTRLERRIAALSPGHYTRMGAAIRHLCAELKQRPQRHRLLLLLTDGKPNDSDYYEGPYAIEDSRRAVQEARRQGIRVFAVTVDREFQAYLPRIFGRGGYAVVHRVEHLPQALPAIYRQLVHEH